MEERINGNKRFVKKYLMLTAACFLYGAGISLFIDPNNLAPGGMSGLSIILNRLIPLETGTIYLILNIPVLLLGLSKFGWRFIGSTLYVTFIVSAATNLFAFFRPATVQPLLGGLFGGILVAVGIGVVMRNGATTGGTDIIVKCLRLRFPHLRTGTLFLMIDAVIIGIGGIVFGDVDAVLYSVISACATSYVLDKVLYGNDGAKLIYIISDEAEAITGRILMELDVGVTHLEGSGAYKNVEKKVIMCVVRKQLAHKVEAIVKEEDDTAFMIISSAAEIYGEGYKSYFGEVL